MLAVFATDIEPLAINSFIDMYALAMLEFANCTTALRCVFPLPPPLPPATTAAAVIEQ